MDELIGRIVAIVGVDRSVAEKAVAIILDFLLKEGPADQVKALVDALPGAAAAVDALRAQGDIGGIFGGMGGIMGVGGRLMSVGLEVAQIRAVTHDVIAYAREKAGASTVDAIAASIPGLGQYV
jgi:hypothetical protein